MTTELDDKILLAEARIARQHKVVALLEARGTNASEAKSTLSAMVYSLRVLRRHQRRLASEKTP